MPGHVNRCAILAEGAFGYEKGPTRPPVEDMVVSGCTIRRGETGVTINDGSCCVVDRNRIEECGVGLTIWWWHMCPQTDIDVENIIRDNVVLKSRSVAISVGKPCYRNQVVNNAVDGKIRVVEADNVVRDNHP
jgi:hypothetical protein